MATTLYVLVWYVAYLLQVVKSTDRSLMLSRYVCSAEVGMGVCRSTIDGMMSFDLQIIICSASFGSCFCGGLEGVELIWGFVPMLRTVDRVWTCAVQAVL